MAEDYPDQLRPDLAIVRRIKEHRAARNLSQNQLAKLIGFPQSCISQIETGKRRLTDGIAEALDKELGTHGEFTMLLEMSRALLIEPGAREVLSREPEAERIRVFNSSVIPGLLQTPDYALALTRASRPNDPEAHILELVAARKQRQQRVFNKELPPVYRAVIDEAALARPVGTDRVMADQLSQLLSYGANRRVRVKMLPCSAREHGVMGGSLFLLDLRGGTLAMVENFRTAQGIESARDVVEYQELYDAVDGAALTVEDSAEMVRQYMKEYEND
jgi:plasmid maintenance system antidote protein VapI